MYYVTVKSRVGMRSEILPEPQIEKLGQFVGLFDALDFIRREAEVHGWRNFTLRTDEQALHAAPTNPLHEPALT